MKFLVDMPLSPDLAQWLRAEGHDAVHANELSMHQSPDSEILQSAGLRGTFRPPPKPPELLSSLGDDPIVEILIHEEPDCPQSVQLRPDLGQETALLARHEQPHRPNHPKAQ